MLYKKALLILLSAVSPRAFAQQMDLLLLGTDRQPITLNQTVFAASKFPDNKKNFAVTIQTLTRDVIESTMPQNTSVMLEKSGNVFIQRSQLGGGSPVLRGFEASRILLLVDGVRMNNAIYRTGHLQNIITVDNNILDRVEIIHGPASTLYGSDALGGAILLWTKDPVTANVGKRAINIDAMTRYSSAWQEGTAHASVNIGMKRLAFLSAATISTFGDLRAGNIRNPFQGDFGLRRVYISRLNGIDSIIQNSDPNIQKGSAYRQFDLMQKILLRTGRNLSHVLNIQYSTSSDIPRYDRLTDKRDGKLRWASWYYGPQERLMTAYNLAANGLVSYFQQLHINLNYQSVKESRFQRLRDVTSLAARAERVSIAGWSIEARRVNKRHELTIGTDGQANWVATKAVATDIVTQAQSPLDSRYPDGGSSMLYAAAFAQHLYKIVEDKLVLNEGVRINSIGLRSIFNDKTFFPLPYDKISYQAIAWSGNVGLVYLPCSSWRLATTFSTGFRAPNVDDIAKVFESAGGVQLSVPNNELKPEYTHNLDVSVAFIIPDRLKMEATGFYASFRDVIVTDRFQLNGADSAQYNGVLTQVVALQNKSSAYLYGFNAGIETYLNRFVHFSATINHTLGRYKDVSGREVPLDHIPPTFGKVSVQNKRLKYQWEVFAIFNGWKRLSEYNPFGEDNLQYATVHGMPAWYTINIRFGAPVFHGLRIDAAVENVLDTHYRTFASGISAPGRNLVITLRGTF